MYSSDEHSKIWKAKIKKGQTYVNRTMEVFSNVLDPFDCSIVRNRLCSIFSNVAVSADSESDIFTPEQQGAKSYFIELQRKKKEVDFFESIKTLNLTIMVMAITIKEF